MHQLKYIFPFLPTKFTLNKFQIYSQDNIANAKLLFKNLGEKLQCLSM